MRQAVCRYGSMNKSSISCLLKGSLSVYITVLLIISGLCQVSIAQCTDQNKQYWPDKKWRTATPEEQGINSRGLAAIFDSVKTKHISVHSITLIRNGYVVLDAYFYPFSEGTLHDLASVTKSVTSTLIGIAIDKDYIKNINQKVLEFFPDRTFSDVDNQKQNLTIKHLLTMTSGFCENGQNGEEQLTRQRLSGDWVQYILDQPLVSEPGKKFAYCSCASNLLSAILTRATGMTAEKFARKYLYSHLGITKVIWPKDPQGNGYGWGDTYMLPTDMAKLGYLFLKEGVWEGRQVVSSDWIHRATGNQVVVTQDDRYGYNWWLRSSPERYEARGRGGQRIVVIPSKQVVLVLTGTADFEPGDIGSLLLPAIQSDKPLPKDQESYDILLQKVTEAHSSPLKNRVDSLPECAQKISGKTMFLETNPYGIKTIRLTFDENNETGTIRYAYSEPLNRQKGTLESPFGLDGVYRISNTSIVHNLPVGARGQWKDDNDFELELNMAGFNHIFLFHFHFGPESLFLRLIDKKITELNLKVTMNEVP